MAKQISDCTHLYNYVPKTITPNFFLLSSLMVDVVSTVCLVSFFSNFS